MPLERLLPHEELALRVALSIRLVLEDDSYSVQAAELCRVAVEVLGSTPLLRRVLVNRWVRWRFRPFPTRFAGSGKRSSNEQSCVYPPKLGSAVNCLGANY